MPLSIASDTSNISLSIALEIELSSPYSRSKVLTLKVLFFKIQSSFLYESIGEYVTRRFACSAEGSNIFSSGP